jgi:hypothetical protein
MIGIDTFKCNMDCTTKPVNFPDFYWQIIKNWFELKKISQKILQHHWKLEDKHSG